MIKINRADGSKLQHEIIRGSQYTVATYDRFGASLRIAQNLRHTPRVKFPNLLYVLHMSLTSYWLT